MQAITSQVEQKSDDLAHKLEYLVQKYVDQKSLQSMIESPALSIRLLRYAFAFIIFSIGLSLIIFAFRS